MVPLAEHLDQPDAVGAPTVRRQDGHRLTGHAKLAAPNHHDLVLQQIQGGQQMAISDFTTLG
jgi:hypothetical protein